MIFKLTTAQENELLSKPETGMGYQVVEATIQGSYHRDNYLVLNSQVVIEMNGYEAGNVNMVIRDGINPVKAGAEVITFSSISVLNEKEFRNILNEPKSYAENGATDNPVIHANGEEIFVRLSAFDDDRRIDKLNKRLLPGSYTTTVDDYIKCKKMNHEPVERYALPGHNEIRFAFYIQALTSDTLQKGIVQPANGKRGGGEEVYFANGTASGTFKKQTPY